MIGCSVVPHSRVPPEHSAHSSSFQPAGRRQPSAKHDDPVHPPHAAVERFHPSHDASHHVQRLRRGWRAVFRGLGVIQSNRFERVLQFARVSHRVGAAAGRNDGPRDDARVLVRSDVPRRELQHIAPFVRVLDDRAGDVFCAAPRSDGPCEEVKTKKS